MAPLIPWAQWMRSSIRGRVSSGLNRYSRSPFNERIKKAFDVYEEFIGIKEVKKTQQVVLKVESEFIESSKLRRGIQNQLIELQDELKQVRQKLDSTHRSDETYLELITNEHKLIKKEIQLVTNLREQEDTERDNFSKFSQTLRDAHEVERLRQEKTKYLSLVGSIVGAVLGIIATSINHALKMKDFKQIVKTIEAQNLANVSLRHELNQNKLEAEEANFAKSTSEANVQKEMSEKSAPCQSETTREKDAQIAELLLNTESNLEYKMKVNSLATVALTYALIAVTIPLIIRIFGDN